MKKTNIVLQILLAFLICQFLSMEAIGSEDEIIILQKQISTLESQKSQLVLQKQALVARGDELSYKIESRKMQSKAGLGIIGKHRLSKELREAQSLSKNIQRLEKEIYTIDTEIKNKRNQLLKEYERQIAILMAGLEKSKTSAERKQTLDKLKAYGTEKEKLEKYNEKELEYLDISQIDIKQHDSSQDIKEKADLVNDYANKLNRNISFLSRKIEELKKERRARIKLGEFADEISFFGGRVSKEEVVASSEKQVTSQPVIKSTEKPVEVTTTNTAEKTADRSAILNNTPSIDNNVDKVTQPEMQPSMDSGTITSIETNTSETRNRMVIEKNGVSANFSKSPLDQLERQIRILEKRKLELEKEKNALSRKAKSLYEKADEIERSEMKSDTKKGK